jgi:hypothetical protein
MRPIKLTPAIKTEVLAEFERLLDKEKMFDGEFKFSKTYVYESQGKAKPAKLVFSPLAFAKMTALIQRTSTEVAWHGTATRDSQTPSLFYISDILVYPQVVSGATVRVDSNKYASWLSTLDNDTFNALRFQGHSHVNMGVTPSGTDLQHQADLLEETPDNSFYIFLICNKSFAYNCKIFDMPSNILYEDKDIEILIGDETLDIESFYNASTKLFGAMPEIDKAKKHRGRYGETQFDEQIYGSLGYTSQSSLYD